MDITFIGHSCFQIRGKECTLVVDPYDPKHVGYNLPKLNADAVLVTHHHPDHDNAAGVYNTRIVIDGPGEYEVNGVTILGYKTFHDTKNGAERGDNTIFLIDVEGLNILHLGDLGHDLPDEVLSELPGIDVLLIPVGGNYTIDAQTASKVISSIEPNFVVPMHYATPDLKFEKDLEPLEKFLDEMGVENGSKKGQDKLTLSSKSGNLEETEVIVLSPKH
ncbi:MAG: MBL fold metallo-hydrolase [Patescibacteria group bacterium]|jgi:L-ascorbate metabolism protein UlaG (beta-lactamase superfamily)